MQIRLIVSMIFLLLFLVGCTKEHRSQKSQQPLYQQKNVASPYTNSTINGSESMRGPGQNEIGYFHYNPENETIKGMGGPQVFIDRNLLADHIAHLVGVLPQVKETTVLVTDDRIFIGVHPKTNKLDATLVRNAKKAAESVAPRYYQVLVTRDDQLISQINQVGGLRMRGSSGVEGVKGDLEELLRKMGDPTPPDVNESIHPSGRTDVNPKEK